MFGADIKIKDEHQSQLYLCDYLNWKKNFKDKIVDFVLLQYNKGYFDACLYQACIFDSDFSIKCMFIYSYSFL